eukprot:6944614-Prymnesium_polylepis.1
MTGVGSAPGHFHSSCPAPLDSCHVRSHCLTASEAAGELQKGVGGDSRRSGAVGSARRRGDHPIVRAPSGKRQCPRYHSAIVAPSRATQNDSPAERARGGEGT